MEAKELYPFVLTLVFTGLILGVGVLIFSNFGDATRVATDINENLSVTAGSGTLTHDELKSQPTKFNNETHDFTEYIGLYVNFTLSTGEYVANGNISTGKYNISYVYYADTSATTTMDSVVTSVTPIASTWLPLIITVAVLAIILTMVIASFTGANRR
jgi:hypothetical protein